MKIAITGLPNSGRTTIFNALTRQNIETTVYPSITSEVHRGTVKVPDLRVDKLSEIYKPHKTIFATIEYIDVPGISPGSKDNNREVLEQIKDADALVQVVRAFEDDTIVHPLNSVDPIRDIATFESEIIFQDFELVDKRLERIDEAKKKGKKVINEQEKTILLKCRDALEQEIPLQALTLSKEEMITMRHLQFFSTKSQVLVLNIHEKDLQSDRNVLEDKIKQTYHNMPVLSLSGKIEMEIAQLPEEESLEYLEAMGIDEPALNKLITLCYTMLKQISFLTVGKDEVRAWTIPHGMEAQKAAGKVHSDIEKGFIRAEVVAYDDFISAGTMAAAKEKAMVRLEGRHYKIKDGDIINFRFNV
jgi:GTP-binding protein YchF